MQVKQYLDIVLILAIYIWTVYMAEGLIVSCVPTTYNEKFWNILSTSFVKVFILQDTTLNLWISKSAILVMSQLAIKIVILMIKGCNNIYVYVHI